MTASNLTLVPQTPFTGPANARTVRLSNESALLLARAAAMAILYSDEHGLLGAAQVEELKSLGGMLRDLQPEVLNDFLL